MLSLEKSGTGLLLALMAAVCYGFIPLFTKELQAPSVGLPLSSSTILFYRFGISSLVLAIIMVLRRESFRINYAEFLRLVLLAFLSDGAALFLISGYRYFSSSGVATTLHFTYPILTALIMMIFSGSGVGFPRGLPSCFPSVAWPFSREWVAPVRSGWALCSS